MNKIRYLFIAILSIVFTGNIVSMEKVREINQKHNLESLLLNLPSELLSKITEEEYRKAINNWNNIFEEPIIDLIPLKGLAETSRYLHQFYTNIFDDLKNLKKDINLKKIVNSINSN